ncbi:MAG TPA: UDP-glucose 4-epimerase GalE [Candidatus Sulfotelmatobacter sp.]|nr:UDP-glucose 4-epimerase GalE [Candidatus Sulfotelmatobacter sp.]
MKLLVTGGAGYIGSVVATQLLAAGHQVTIIDNLSRGHRQAIPQGAELVVADLSDKQILAALFRAHSFDGVLHFAAFIEAGESMKAPETFFRNNTANALSVLEAMLAARVNRFVFSSTAALYGNPARTPIREEDTLRPTNAYGESKLLVERMLEWFHRIHGLRYASLRYFNAAGAAAPDRGEAHQPETHLIPRLMNVALGRQKHIEIFGTDYPTSDGTCVRDYIHVSDLAAAHLLALDALDRSGQLLYNLGNGQGFTVREVIDGVRRVTGCAIPIVESPRREGDPAVLIASSDKIRKELHWQPQFPDLDAILHSAWQWHKKFPNGYPED